MTFVSHSVRPAWPLPRSLNPNIMTTPPFFASTATPAQASVITSLGDGSRCATALPDPAQRPPSERQPGIGSDEHLRLCRSCPGASGASPRLENERPTPSRAHRPSAIGPGVLAHGPPLGPRTPGLCTAVTCCWKGRLDQALSPAPRPGLRPALLPCCPSPSGAKQSVTHIYPSDLKK